MINHVNVTNINCKDPRFGVSPKREWIQAHVAQTMNLQSEGKKASLILGQNIGFQCKKDPRLREQYVAINPLRTYPSDLIFLFLVSLPSVFPRLIYHNFFAFLITHVWTWHSTSFFRHPPRLLLNLPFLAGKLLVHCSGITSTLMRPEGQLGDI